MFLFRSSVFLCCSASFINKRAISAGMVKCDLCGDKVKTTFLGKLLGTIIKVKGKKKYVCQTCQKQHDDLKGQF